MTVCAVVVTYNRQELLRHCLTSLKKQTRPLDCILVVDNASTDGTRAMLDVDLPDVQRLNLSKNTGCSGGVKAGMEWAFSRGYDWIWVSDDNIEFKPECLETLLSWQHLGDVIHARKQTARGIYVWEGVWEISGANPITLKKEVSFENGKKWIPVQTCNFEGALIRRSVVERIGFPDERYFLCGDDAIYGFIASLHANVIYINYVGILRNAKEGPRGRLSYYLNTRNRFITYEHMVNHGVPLRRSVFLARTFLAAARDIVEAIGSHQNRWKNVSAATQGIYHGLRGHFGPPSWV